MDTEFAAQSTQLSKHTREDVDNIATTILLSETSMTNGAGDADCVETIEFLEEPEALIQSDPTGEFNALDGDENSTSPQKVHAVVTKGHNNDDDEETREEVAKVRTPTQVPKKRRDAVLLAAVAMESCSEEEIENEDGDMEEERVAEHDNDVSPDKQTAEENDVEEYTKVERITTEDDEEELPTSSVRVTSNKETSVDEDQCRVCMTKDDLVSLFKKVDSLTVAELLMIICPTVSIARKDFMPQYICNTCLENVTIAVQLKSQCETTEKELRKNLSRSKNKVRRPTGYVVIDAPIESDPQSEEEPKDDIEFKVSDVEVSASGDDDSSDDSDFGATKKRRPGRGGGAGGRRGRRKSTLTTPAGKVKERKRMGRPPMRKHHEHNESSDDEAAEYSMPKQKKRKYTTERAEPVEKPTEFPCDECEQVFNRKLSLVLHKKAHSGAREPINCEVCGKQFKIQGAYRSHLEKHKEYYTTSFSCSKCPKVFMSKADLRKHIGDVHEDVSVMFTCDKCKRVFTTQQRLLRHKDSRCPGFEVKGPRKADIDSIAVGKDLFKSVAPLTTTYWSDSFSD